MENPREAAGQLCGGCFREYNQTSGPCPVCGFDPEVEKRRRGMGLPLFTMLAGRYLVGRVLGAGGFGITYLALDLQTGVSHAVKEYFPADIALRCADGTVEPIRDEKLYERYRDGFYGEARLLREMKESPYVVHVSAFFRGNNTAYLVMDYIDGEDLKKHAEKAGGTLPYGEACQLTLQLARALSDVHKKGILHRDVNPQNALLDKSGNLRLIDFGSSRMGFRDAGKSVSIRLTEGYAAPEQYYLNGRQGPWTDEYAMACTFYRLVTGIPLPSALDRQHKDTVLPLTQMVAGADQKVSDAIARAMQLDAKKRYRNMEAFIDDFSAFQENTRTVTLPGSAFVELLDGPARGMTVELRPGRTIAFGRQRAMCDLVVSRAPVVSRRHCELSYDGEKNGVLVTDCSENGTYLSDGTPIRRETVLVTRETTVRLASSDAVFRIRLS